MSLRDFYDRFTTWKWNGCDPFSDIDLEARVAPLPAETRHAHRTQLSAAADESLAEALRIFAKGELQAYVILPESGERRHLSVRSWKEAFFGERMFLANDIGSGHGSEFDAVVSRTPFVAAASVSGYLRANWSAKRSAPSSVALRELLIGLVMDGIATPKEAEDFASRWNIPDLASSPPSERYDPRKQAAWTLVMALSWLVWRSFREVRDACEEYRAHSLHWVSVKRRLPINGGRDWHEVQGAELQPRRPLTMLTMSVMEALEQKEEYSAVVMSVKTAREELWTKLAEAKLVAAGIDANGAVGQIPPHEWPYLALEADRDLGDRLVFPNSGAREAYRRVTVNRTDMTSLWPPSPEPPEVPMIDDLLEELEWTFMDAALWVGCRGRDVPSQEVADKNLMDLGARELFGALFPKRDLVATGLNRKRLREPIPAEYWEMATLDPGAYRERHYLSFIDDVMKGYGGQLTPVGEDNPRWFGIRLARDQMLAAFPKIVATLKLTSESGAGGQQAVRSQFSGQSRKLAAAVEALGALYPQGIPTGLAEKSRTKAVNDWLKAGGHSEISQRTLARATKRWNENR